MTLAVRRGGFVLPLLSVLLGGILVSDVSTDASASQHRAASSCSLNVPARVAISAPYQSPSVTLGADCAAAGVIDASWVSKRADGVVTNKLFFNFNYPESWSVYDNASLAPVTWQPAGARSTTNPAIAGQSETPATGAPDAPENQPADVSVPQNTPTTDIRMMSKVELLPYENDECHGHVWAQRYAITPHGLIGYGGRSGSIQQLNPSSGGWFVLTSFTTDSTGHWLGRVTSPSPVGSQASLRVVIYDAQYIFGSISPTYSGEVGIDCSAPARSERTQLRVLGLRG